MAENEGFSGPVSTAAEQAEPKVPELEAKPLPETVPVLEINAGATRRAEPDETTVSLAAVEQNATDATAEESSQRSRSIKEEALRQLNEAAWMAEWTETQVFEWISWIDLPSLGAGVDVTIMVQAAFAADGGGIDGEELVEMREKILQRMLSRVGVKDAAMLAGRILTHRDATLGEADRHLELQGCQLSPERSNGTRSSATQ